MEEQFEAALGSHDKDSAMKVVYQMQAKYTDDGTSEQDRQRMALSMDRMRAANDKMSRGGNMTAAESLTAFDAARKGMETKRGFGLPPTPAAGEKVYDYVNTHFGLSSGERIDAAMVDIDLEKTTAQGEAAAIDAELASLRGVEKTVADKSREIAQVRQQIQKAIDKEVDSARQPKRIAERKLRTVEREHKEGKATDAELKEATQKFEQAKTKFDAGLKKTIEWFRENQ